MGHCFGGCEGWEESAGSHTVRCYDQDIPGTAPSIVCGIESMALGVFAIRLAI